MLRFYAIVKFASPCNDFYLLFVWLGSVVFSQTFLTPFLASFPEGKKSKKRPPKKSLFNFPGSAWKRRLIIKPKLIWKFLNWFPIKIVLRLLWMTQLAAWVCGFQRYKMGMSGIVVRQTEKCCHCSPESNGQIFQGLRIPFFQLEKCSRIVG